VANDASTRTATANVTVSRTMFFMVLLLPVS
jgi:hypothetical protein